MSPDPDPRDDAATETPAGRTPAGATDARPGRDDRVRPRRVPSLVVWGVAALGTIAGLLLALAGLGLLGFADRGRVEQLVSEEAIQAEGFTDAEAVDLALSVTWWGGLGLVVTGGVLVLAGVGFLAYQRRVGRRYGRDDVGTVTVWTAAVLGAFVTILTSFLAVSPLLGGGIAGYLRGGERLDGAIVGGIASLLAGLPAVVILGFFGWGVIAGLPDPSVYGGLSILLAAFFVGALFVLAVAAILGGIGGVVGNALGGGMASDSGT